MFLMMQKQGSHHRKGEKVCIGVLKILKTFAWSLSRKKGI